MTPNAVVSMAWHQNTTANLAGDSEWRPASWWREEFSESPNATHAREILESWLMDCRLALGHVLWIMETVPQTPARPPGRPAAHPGGRAGDENAVMTVSLWLDDVLYGQGKRLFPKGEWSAIQVAADSMPRHDFCRMDFREVVKNAREAGVAARQLPLGRTGSSRTSR